MRSTVWALTLTRQVVHSNSVLLCLHTFGVQCLLKAQDRQQLCILRNVAVWKGKIYVIQDGKHAHTVDLTELIQLASVGVWKACQKKSLHCQDLSSPMQVCCKCQPT